MAKAGKGYAEFVASGERLEGKVLRQLKRALHPVFKEISVDWGTVHVKQQSPNPLPPLFDGERMIVRKKRCVDLICGLDLWSTL